MPDERMITVAERLLERTRTTRLRWQAAARPKDAGDDWEPRSFVTRLQHGSVTVSSEHADGRFPYELHLRDPTGQHIGELETGDADAWLGDRQPAAWEQALADLYEVARSSALSTTASLDAVVAELSD
jgi:hypothetical protein